MLTRSTSVLFCLVGLAAAARADVPPLLTYQGRLLKGDGTPVTETVNVAFTLYALPTTTVPAWSETHALTPDFGYFTVVLGEVGTGGTAFPANLFTGRPLYLGVKVGADPEMTPRSPILSSPYALLATPTAHAQTHMIGGGDEIATLAAAPLRIPMSGPAGTLDASWMPVVPLSKGGTGTAAPRETRNLCVFTAGPVPVDASRAPTLRVPPELNACVVTSAFASAGTGPAASFSWNYAALSAGGQSNLLSQSVGWPSGSLVSDAPASGGASPLPAGTVVAPFAANAPAAFMNATFCLQLSCELSFH